MKLKLLFLLFLASLPSFAQYTLIPDVKFENRLIALGIDSGTADGKVLTANVSSVTTLNVTTSGIADLTGIQAFVGLTKLDCHGNYELTSLDVTKNTALTWLDCSNNQLTSLDVSKNVSLTHLDCQFSQLTALDVSNNTALNNLFFSYNQLTTLDVSKNTALTYLNCDYNKLTSLDVSNNTALKSLVCSSNELTALDVSQNSFLGRLNCSSNQLTTLDVSKNTALIILNCDSNKLISLNVKNGINAYFNGNNFTKNPDLSCIQVDDVAYSNANWGTKKDATAGYTTDCSLQYTLIPDLKFENKLIALGIDTDGANGRVLTASVSSLTSLNVSNSSITNLTGIQDFLALKTLYCESNQLKTLDVSKNVSLTYLDCDANQLTSLDASKNTALTYLSCAVNFSLNNLDVSKNIALQILRCLRNKLTGLDVSMNTALQKLSCYGNQLATLDVSNNTALTILECSSNELTTLDISKNSSLTYLDCSSNQLTSLNLKNGNNVNLNGKYFTNNPNLSCIQVDNAAYSDKNWATVKDAIASYNTNCPSVQYTLIPDVNFEKKLIALGFDSGTADGKVLTFRISTVTSLDVSSSSITDLTGIQDFAALIGLDCHSNKLTSLDLSKNVALTSLDCRINKLTTLDVSTNSSLIYLDCSSNQLTSLNLKNGNNVNFYYYNFTNNPDLSCIQVDDAAYSNKNWAREKDVSAIYNTNCASVQYTLIPDVNFEKRLIALRIDFGTPNGKVLTDNVSSLTFLDVSSSSITDLTGIQDFVALTSLYCDTNQLTSLDVSKNIALINLDCNSNQLTSLVSKNTNLREFVCYSNQLTTLDVSGDIGLGYLNCSSNQLTSLNLKKGNNDRLVSFSDFTNNPNLTCIQVDDVAYANANLSTAKDATASYSDNCPAPSVVISNEFEDKLIALGIDTDGKNGSVLLESITNVTSIDVSNSGITDLSGIKYFTDLETLICKGNSLTAINVSYNTALKYLDCSQNPLSALDVTKNRQLIELYCDGIETVIYKKSNAKTSGTNQLTVLDLSNNLLLTKLDCSDNLIVSLDVSKNTLLTDIDCSNNQLTYLNLNNGNNSKLVNVNFKSNASLSCIQVDDNVYANANWSVAKDVIATYSKTACTLGIEDVVYNTIAVYPNPVKDDLHIDNVIVEKATVYDTLGKLVKTKTFSNGSNNNTINLAGLPSGIYYIYLESQGATAVKKIVVE